VEVSFSSSEDHSTFECRVDAKPFASCQSPVVLKLEVGRHRFYVRAIDTAGNADRTEAMAKIRIVDGGKV
jgi:hypothetical protein